jgi:hypothetical protein
LAAGLVLAEGLLFLLLLLDGLDITGSAEECAASGGGEPTSGLRVRDPEYKYKNE